MALAASFLLSACARETGPEAASARQESELQTSEAAAPLVGAWELIHGEYTDPTGSTTIAGNGRPFQLKLFTGTHFAYVMGNEDGSFREAGAGPYTLEGDTYRETHAYQSESQLIGFTANWTYRVSGDTLYMEGPTQVWDAAGNEVTEQVSRMQETRIRASAQAPGHTPGATARERPGG
jgi:hypothetical protein